MLPNSSAYRRQEAQHRCTRTLDQSIGRLARSSIHKRLRYNKTAPGFHRKHFAFVGSMAS
jgi:hypothetical protein